MRKIWMLINIPRLLIALLIYLYYKDEMEDDLNAFLNYITKRKLKTKIISMFSLLLFKKEDRNIFLFGQ